MDNTAQINQLKRKIGEALISGGIGYTRESISDILPIEKSQDHLRQAISNFGMAITFLDSSYFTTSFENWKKIIEIMNPICQKFAWTKEKFDCDNRALLMSSLIAVMFGLNSCSPCYCDVFNVNGTHIDWHYNNLIIDDAGNVYLWDVDNHGTVQKITSNTPVMNNWKYNLVSIRPF
jgi:hypothetical protein